MSTGPADPRLFVVCETCQGWGRVVTVEADGRHRTAGVCPECNGTGEEVRVDGVAA